MSASREHYRLSVAAYEANVLTWVWWPPEGTQLHHVFNAVGILWEWTRAQYDVLTVEVRVSVADLRNDKVAAYGDYADYGYVLTPIGLAVSDDLVPAGWGRRSCGDTETWCRTWRHSTVGPSWVKIAGPSWLKTGSHLVLINLRALHRVRRKKQQLAER